MKTASIILVVLTVWAQPVFSQLKIDHVFGQMTIGGSTEGLYGDMELGVKVNRIIGSIGYSSVEELTFWGKSEESRSLGVFVGFQDHNGFVVQMGPSMNWITKFVEENMDPDCWFFCSDVYADDRVMGAILKVNYSFSKKHILGIGMEVNMNKYRSYIGMGARFGLNFYRKSEVTSD